MFLLNPTKLNYATTVRILGTSDGTLNDGWDIYSSSSLNSLTLRARNAGTEWYAGGNSITANGVKWTHNTWTTYETQSTSGYNFTNGSWKGNSVNTGSASVAVADPDFWMGWSPGAGSGQGYEGLMQHVCMFDQKLEDYEIADFYMAFKYNGDV